jgi:hypothetical protein
MRHHDGRSKLTQNKRATAASHLLHANDASGKVRVVVLAFFDIDAGGRIPAKCKDKK